MNNIFYKAARIAVLMIGLLSASVYAETGAANLQAANGQPQDIPKDKVSAIVKDAVNAAKAGNGKKIVALISKEYLETLEAFAEMDAQHDSAAKEVLANFDYYTLNSIESVTIDNDVAFVQAKVDYKPSKLAEVRKDAKERGSQITWTDMGGTSYTSKVVEKKGVGLATYFLVLQGNAWKIHFTCFSLQPMSPKDLAFVSKSMKTLVHK
ncbi:MAG: hypothetical protein WCO68_01075 [Verrucomicrobiota bacterium]